MTGIWCWLLGGNLQVQLLYSSSPQEGWVLRKSFPRVRNYNLPIIISLGVKNLGKLFLHILFVKAKHRASTQQREALHLLKREQHVCAGGSKWWPPCWKPFTTGSLRNTIFHIRPLRKYRFSPCDMFSSLNYPTFSFRI